MADLDPDRARRDAERVLEGDRYQQRDVPRPLRGVLKWIGDRLEAVGGPLYDVLATPAGAVVITAVLAGLSALGVVVAVRRRNLTANLRSDTLRRLDAIDPRQLDREAEAAEGSGDFAGAVRFRFRAGVVRLETAGIVPARADATTARLIAEVPSPGFPAVALAFDEIAYGGRTASAADAERARSGWSEVLGDVRAATARRSSDDDGGDT